MSVPFVHLHVHSDYSLLDGAVRISSLLDTVKDFGMTSVALTDNAVMYGAVDFYFSAKAKGIHPIIGCELYLVDDMTVKQRDWTRLIVLCKSYRGYQQLSQLVSKAHVDGFYYKPRIDKDLIREYNEGLICTSGCLAGEVNYYASIDDYENAKKTALEYQEIFGDRFYLEVQNHGIDKELNRSFSLLVEYDAALNDNLDNDDDALNNIFGKGKGYLNAGIRWAMSPNIMLEINFNDINQNTEAEYTNREVKIMYSESF